MAKYSILIVEDERTLRRLLEYRMSKQFNVRTAANGEEALERIKEEIPDLIISDIMMPKMNGYALLDELQKDEKTEVIPFIFLTAKADQQSRLQGIRTGIDDYITKPFDVEHLLARIEVLVKRYKRPTPAIEFPAITPEKLPQVAGYRMSFHLKPREDVGGDIFDWTEAESGVFFFTIGDVMGKGLKAKLISFGYLGYIRTTLRTMLQDSKSPAELMRRVNRVLMQDEFMQETFASLLIMRWDPATHQITYANAGHCRPVLVAPEGPEVVAYSDMVLGLDMNAEFQDTHLTIPPGSALLTYTDGLIEQHLIGGQMVGEQGILEMSPHALGQPRPIHALLNEVLNQSPVNEFSDDILVFWLERSH